MREQDERSVERVRRWQRVAVGAAVAAAVLWFGAVPARGEEVPGEIRFTPPPGWAPSDELQAALARTFRHAFAYTLDDETRFAVMLMLLDSEMARGPIRRHLDDYVQGMMDRFEAKGLPATLTRTESATTLELVIDIDLGASKMRQRAVAWFGRDRSFHAVIGTCTAPGAASEPCLAALSSIQVTAPEELRLPLSSAAPTERSIAYKLGQLMAMAVIALAVLAIVLFLVRRS